MARFKIVNSKDGTNNPWHVVDTAPVGAMPGAIEVVDTERNRANARVALALAKKNAARAPAKPVADTPEPAENPQPATSTPTTGKVGGRVGIIATIVDCMKRDDGASIPEIVAELVSRFPERAEKGLTTTARIQVGRWPKKHGVTVEKARDKARGGMVYKLVS